jgi:hypothetical protein
VSGTWDPLVEVIALSPGLAQRVLERHRDDGTGHCCVCGSGGQTGRYTWPCSLRLLATRALHRQAQMHAEIHDPAIPLHGPDD